MTSLFLSTLSLRRATHGHCAFRHAVDISIHALLAESDVVTRSGSMRYLDFYPRSPCGERLFRCGQADLRIAISIHALLAESDGCWPRRARPSCYFYPRSPCGERLGTHSPLEDLCYFYPRSPCGERRGGDTVLTPQTDFYPRSPCGERPLTDGSTTINLFDFYPRSPCGERQRETKTNEDRYKFLSTLSLRRATVYALKFADPVLFLSTLSLRRATRILHFNPFKTFISIHALLAESDPSANVRSSP